MFPDGHPGFYLVFCPPQIQPFVTCTCTSCPPQIRSLEGYKEINQQLLLLITLRESGCFPCGSAAVLFAQVFLKEKARQLLERRWNQRQSWAIVTLQRNFRRLLRRRRLRVLQEKVIIIQSHFRGYQARSGVKDQARYSLLSSSWTARWGNACPGLSLCGLLDCSAGRCPVIGMVEEGLTSQSGSQH